MSDQQKPPLAAEAPPGPDPTIGLLLADRYQITGLVGRGGMARVYRADDERLGREVAIKILGPPYADSQPFIDRFLEEARAAAGLSHPNLVHVYDSGSDGGLHFIVMELLERYRSVRERLSGGGPLAVDEALDLGAQLLDGLEAVHARGLVHCDVKAGNVLLGPGPLKLIDFGIARVSDDRVDGESSIGSLAYMSPEQLRGDALTPASDLFAVGVVLYEALTGELPFRGSNPDEMLAAHRGGPPARPSQLRPEVAPRLDDAILQALEPAPEQRFRSASAMRRAIESAQPAGVTDDTTQVHAVARPEVRAPSLRPDPTGRVARTPQRRSGAWLWPFVILAAAAIVALIVVVPLLQLGARNAPAPGGATSPAATAIPAGNRVTVPNTVGLGKDAAIAAATTARLNWTIQCNQDPKKPAGMVGQQPAAGTVVAAGAPFTMFSARIADCR